MQYLSSDDKLLVVIGPSGAGKSSVVQLLQEDGLIVVTPSWTTRPPRPEEATGAIEHHFTSEAEFRKKESKGYFLETVQMFGLPYSYGLPKVEKPINNSIPVIMLRASLLPLLGKHYSHYTVYQIEDDIAKIKARLLERQTAGQQIGSRLEDYEKEITAGRKLASRVFNNSNTLESLAQEIKEAIDTDF